MAVLRGIARRVMLERHLLPDFSAAALQQTASINQPAMESGAAIRDLRGLLWASIDNDDSRDLDQLSVAQPLPGGTVKLLVAIADVDAIVKPGSPIDEHARGNTTSVYTVPQIFPMLPEKLSTDLTSLAEGQDRMAIIVEMTVAAEGKVTESALYRGVVRNRAKLAYNSVAAWLEGKGAAPERLAAVPGLDQNLRVQDQAAQALRRIRFASGALALQTLEAQPVFNGDLLSDLLPDQNNRAKELIEDLMIAANGVSARYFEASGRPSLRRVLRTPKRWERIVALAAALHEQLPSVPNALALNQFLARRRQADPERFPDLSLSVIKLLGRGEYVLELPGQPAPGHFGLAVRDYAHTTAPNRRFPDLISQRLLKAVLTQSPAPYDEGALAGLAAHCTEQEDNAAKVERQVGKSAAALLLTSRVGQSFDGIITGAADKGTWVRIASPMAEGRLVKGFEGLDVGDHARVKLVHTDVARGFIDFQRVP